MTIQVDSLLSLDPLEVQAAAEQVGALLEEYAPEADARRGALGALLVRLSAALANKRSVEFERLMQSQSFYYIEQDPTLADDDIVDAAASNFRKARMLGGNATGQVSIVIDRLQTVIIAVGTQFEASGRIFTTETAYAARTSQATVQSSTDRVLTPLPDGNYAFTVQVVAAEAGEAGQLKKDTLLTMDPPPLAFVKAFAAEDFTGGADTETNAQLLERLVTGVTSQTMSDRPSMRAALAATPEFARCVASSIIGFGMAEMLRDRHSLWPGSTGGRVDWYIRTQLAAQRTLLVKEATLVEIDDTGYGIWQVEFDRDEAAGVFDVVKIVTEGADTTTVGTYELLSDARGVDLTAISGTLLPDITSSVEAVYSRFQTIIVRFLDSDTPVGSLELGAKANYDCVLRKMPLIADISDYFTQISRLHGAGDVLVKAPVPCFLSVSLTIEMQPNQEEPDTDEIANAIVALINAQYSFTGRLSASVINDIVHNYLPELASVGAIDLLGEIRRPDGVTTYLHSESLLTVPDRPDVMTSGRTVVFFLDTADVTIAVTTVDVPET
jgi:hypothetical protein